MMMMIIMMMMMMMMMMMLVLARQEVQLLCCSLSLNLLHAAQVQMQSRHNTELPTIAETREETQLGPVCASSHVISIVGQIDGFGAIGRQQDILLAQAQPGNWCASTA